MLKMLTLCTAPMLCDKLHAILNTDYYSSDFQENFIKESLKMEELKHPHVMSLLGVCLDAGPAPYIVLPYMGNGDLLSFLKKHRDSLLVTPEEDNEVLYTIHCCC